VKRIVFCVAVAASSLSFAATAVAAAPTANTGPAKSVTGTTATLTGTINPNGQATTYRFEYGTTASYGNTTADQTTAATNAKTDASATVSNLTSGVTYHYRLIITNPAGTKPGADKTFTTSAGISLSAAPGAITFGKQVVLSGQLQAPNPGNVKVTLEQDTAPFNASEFKNVTTATTDATGKFTFSQAPTANTQYRVTTRNPDSSSSAVTVPVRLRVALNASKSRVKRGKTVTFSGTVTPPRAGQLVRIQKKVGTRWRTVKHTALVPSSDPNASSFKVRVRIRKTGTYRALASGDVMNATGASGARRVRAV
jgi:hypothetical protein